MGTYLSNKLGGTLLSTHYYPVSMRVENVLYAYGQYIVKLFFPVGLSVFYPLPDLRLTPLSVLPPLLLLIGVTVLALRLAHKAPYLLVGWFWFLGTLVPVIGLIHVGSMQSYADRYTYFTYTGAFVALAWVVYRWVAGRGLRARIAVYAFSLLLLVFGTQTALQVMVWKDTESLFSHSLEVAPEGNYVALAGLGMVYYNKYKNLQGAKILLKKSIEIAAVAPAWKNLGSLLLHEGKFKEAEACLRQGLEMSPRGDAKVRSDLAYVCVQEGKYREALDFAKQAVALSPHDPHTRMFETDALLGLGRCKQAESVARDALARNPKTKGLSIRLAVALMGQGRTEEADRFAQRAIQEGRGNPAIYFEMAKELLLLPSPTPSTLKESLSMARRAAVLTNGGQPWYLLTLGQALRANGQTKVARETLEHCLSMAETKKIEGLIRLARQALADLQQQESETGKTPPAAKDTGTGSKRLQVKNGGH